MCICVRVWYICVFMCIHVCVCTWLHVWTYWYAHICVCIGVCVFPIFIWHFNPSSIFLYIIYIAHCASILLCTLMLYICDRSTPDLNKDDELNWTISNKVAVPNDIHLNWSPATVRCVSSIYVHIFGNKDDISRILLGIILITFH